MRTDDLVLLLAADARRVTNPPPVAALSLLAIGLAAAIMIFLIGYGARGDIDEQTAMVATGAKIAFTGLLILAGVRGALLLMSPEGSRTTAFMWLAAPALMLALLVAVEFALLGAVGAGARAIGGSAPKCVVSVTGLSLAPLAAFLAGLRRGAPVQPRIAGALAGVAAGGIGATLYAFHCIEDSALFLGLWYGAGVILVTALGSFLGPRVLRW
jgi:hypothetical protein